ncbi:hypothetical protein [Bacteroides gallinarum]|uniref:hypothetical protein n=2 Tax=Bacteroides gallinarum TaxID=376806 RepID=UPI00036308A0|nr:hypothetical protein [Bacteroides gallinarum]
MSMNQEKKKEECGAPHAAPSPEQVLEKGNEAETVPGQQIGLYGKADKKDVRRMVKILNPDKDSMESRG